MKRAILIAILIALPLGIDARPKDGPIIQCKPGFLPGCVPCRVSNS